MSTSISQVHSIFEQPWWLDAVAPGQWDAVEIEEGGRVVARLPFVYKKKFGLRIVGQPPLTQTLGPWIEHTSDSPEKRIAREKDLFLKLISRLPRFDVFHQNFHSNVKNWLPFYWSGFEQTTGYSYAIEDLTNLEAIHARMSAKLRQHIRRAEKRVRVQRSDGIDEVLRTAELTFQRQGMKLPYPPELLHRIDEASKRHGQRRALFGFDDAGNIHSSAYIVGDSERSYLLVTGANPEFRSSASGALVHWTAITEAAAFTKVFDFEGSMLEPVESFYRSFGASQVPYLAVSKTRKSIQLAFAARQLLVK